MLEEKFISSEIMHEGNFLKFDKVTVELPNGKVATRDVIRHPGASAVIPINEKGEVFMVKQFRAAIGQVMYEVPAGKLDKTGEDPLLCAKRELKEETGLTADKYIHLTSYYSAPGFTDEILHLYAALELHEGESETDEDEFLQCEKVHISKLLEMVKNQQITDSKTIMSVFFAEKIINNQY